jgi:ketosteroid isomerase-like protein
MDSADQALLEADRALAVAVQDRGLGSGIADVAELDAMVLTPSGVFTGIEQIRVGLKPTGNAGQLFWVPEKASMGSSGDYGSTTGRYVQVLRGAEAVQGRYVTVWRKDSSRTWKVVSTTALPVRIVPPPPPKPLTPVTPPRRTVRR